MRGEPLYRRLQCGCCLCRCACKMTSYYEICWTFIAFVFSTIWCGENPPFESQGKQCDFRRGSILWFSPPPRPLYLLQPLKRVKQRAEGAQSAFIYREATFMCGLTADISNIKLWAASETPGSSAWLLLLSQRWRELVL